MNSKVNSSDPDILSSLEALQRAARNARKLAELTRTPFYIVRDGKIVNLNARPTKRRKTA